VTRPYHRRAGRLRTNRGSLSSHASQRRWLNSYPATFCTSIIVQQSPPKAKGSRCDFASDGETRSSRVNRASGGTYPKTAGPILRAVQGRYALLKGGVRLLARPLPPGERSGQHGTATRPQYGDTSFHLHVDGGRRHTAMGNHRIGDLARVPGDDQIVDIAALAAIRVTYVSADEGHLSIRRKLGPGVMKAAANIRQLS
jgi:hypothetical protein